MKLKNGFSPTNYPIQGDLVETIEGLIFEIIDFHQPKDCCVAFLRYVPTEKQSSSRIRKRDPSISTNSNSIPTSYQKIYSMKERIEFLKTNYPEYLFNHKNYYFSLQSIPFSKIKNHFKPETFFNNILENKQHLTPLLQDAIDFCQFLTQEAKIPPTKIGITGSLLAGLETENSDIDIIIYGFGNSLKVRDVLRECLQNNTINPDLIRYNLSDFKKLYKFRMEHKPISFYSFLNYEIRKLHQGKFRGRDFFIRFLEYPSRELYYQTNQFDTRSIQSLGRITIEGEIRCDEFWWTTPARVLPINIYITDKSGLKEETQSLLKKHNLNLEDIYQTFTLRGRFIENVRLLEHFRANGTLELVCSDHNSAYLQINFAQHPADYFTIN